MTNQYYKKFTRDYDRDNLLSLYNSLPIINKGYYKEVNLDSTAIDLVEYGKQLFGRELEKNEYCLIELVSQSGFHTNPRNNGVIVFPVLGIASFDFKENSVLADGPVAVNGRQLHNYSPDKSTTVWFVLKIPSGTQWPDLTALL